MPSVPEAPTPQGRIDTLSGWLMWAGLPMALVVGLLSLPVMDPAHKQTLFLRLNHAAAHYPDAVWSFFTLLGDTTLLFVLLAPLLLRAPRAVVAAMIAAPIGGIMSLVAKNILDAPRPGALLEPEQFHLIGPLWLYNSFPSGHTLTAFAAISAVLISVVPTLQRRRGLLLTLGLVSLASLIGFSRIAVGAHWPQDVVGGAGIGWLAGLTGVLVMQRFPSFWQSELSLRIIASFLATLGLWLIITPLDYPRGSLAAWIAAIGSWVGLALNIRKLLNPSPAATS
ncbi:phosphatase PAP2 family protein [Leptothrix ochracea]